MNGVIHPFSKALYEATDDGRVKVTAGERVGYFTQKGKWLSGEIKDADPHLCSWVGGPQVAHHRLQVPTS
jgi:hypothetical protein